MNPVPSSPADDITSVRSLLAPTNPVPDPSLAPHEVLAARSAVGAVRALPVPPRASRGRFALAGAVALVSVATLVAVVAVPSRRGADTTVVASGPGAKAVRASSAATQASGTARGQLTVTHGGMTVTAIGVGDFASGAARAEVTATGGGAPAATLTVVRTGTGLYARLPDGFPLAAGKPWVSVDAATLASLTQMASGDLGAQLSGSPLDALAYLRAVSGDVQEIGPDTTRGEPTTHYRGTVDPAKAAVQLPGSLPPRAATAASAVGPLPADLWIDGQGRLRKLTVTAQLTPGAVPAAGTEAPAPGEHADELAGPATMTVELWDFGTPVDVKAPPADQVSDVGGLLGTALQGRKTP